MKPVIAAPLLWVAALAASSYAKPSPYEPIIRRVAVALQSHPVVGIGDAAHRAKQAHALQVALIRDPRVLCQIDVVAVEFGNSALQQIADDYVSGRTVPLSEKRRIWRDTGQWLVWDSPLYEDFFDAVRDVNWRKLCAKPVRVLLADPPIDWQKVTNADQYRPYRIRDEFAAALIDREVIDKNKRALLIFGDTHLWKALPRGSVEKPRMGMLLERHRRGSLISFAFLPKLDLPANGLLPRAPSLTLLRGTALGRRPARALMPSDDTVAMSEGGKLVERPLNAVDWPANDKLVDGYLNLGPLTEVDPDPAIYREQSYQTELRRRARILKAVHGIDFEGDLDGLLASNSKGTTK